MSSILQEVVKNIIQAPSQANIVILERLGDHKEILVVPFSCRCQWGNDLAGQQRPYCPHCSTFGTAMQDELTRRGYCDTRWQVANFLTHNLLSSIDERR